MKKDEILYIGNFSLNKCDRNPNNLSCLGTMLVPCDQSVRNKDERGQVRKVNPTGIKICVRENLV